MSSCVSCFNHEGDGRYKMSVGLQGYQNGCGVNTDNVADSAGKIDSWFSGFRDLLMLAYFVGMMNGVQISQLKITVAGLEICLTGITFVRLCGGVEKIVTCKITKEDKFGNSGEWKKRAVLSVAAEVMLIFMRMGICVFALETVGALQLGSLSPWMGMGVLVAGVTGTLLSFFNSIHQLTLRSDDDEEECNKRKSLLSNFLHSVCLASDMGIVMPGPYPLGIAITAISAVSNLFDAVNECVAKHPSTKLIPG